MAYDIMNEKHAKALMEKFSNMTQEEKLELWQKIVEERQDIKYDIAYKRLIGDHEQVLKHKNLKKISKL